MKGLVTKSTGSWYRVKTDEGFVNARLRGKFKLDDKKITNPIAVGDTVILEQQADEWMIAEIDNRTNYIIRRSPKKKHHDHLIAANVDQAIMIATFKEPRTSLGFIDRFLVTLEAFRIPGVIIFNKTDILAAEELEALNFLQFIYEKKVGYQFLKTSFLHNALSPEIVAILKGKTTMLSGHSGAGKSTLVNLLLPEVDQKTAEISGFANKGVHTTTFAEMFFLDETTAIIDTPGIKELGLSEIEPEELAHYFPEMRAFLGECRFHNCLHNGEPGCAIQNALENGVIMEERYNSYLSMLQPDDNRR